MFQSLAVPIERLCACAAELVAATKEESASDDWRGEECVVVSAWLPRNVERELLQAGIGTSMPYAPGDIG